MYLHIWNVLKFVSISALEIIIEKLFQLIQMTICALWVHEKLFMRMECPLL